MKMQRNYLSLAIAIVLTGIISVSAHVFIFQHSSPPELNINPLLNQECGYAIHCCTVIASLVIYFLSKEYWERITPLRRTILFGILIMALTESLFRTSMMNIIVGNSWLYQILVAIPSYLEFFSLLLVICFLGHAASS